MSQAWNLTAITAATGSGPSPPGVGNWSSLVPQMGGATTQPDSLLFSLGAGAGSGSGTSVDTMVTFTSNQAGWMLAGLDGAAGALLWTVDGPQAGGEPGACLGVSADGATAYLMTFGPRAEPPAPTLRVFDVATGKQTGAGTPGNRASVGTACWGLTPVTSDGSGDVLMLTDTAVARWSTTSNPQLAWAVPHGMPASDPPNSGTAVFEIAAGSTNIIIAVGNYQARLDYNCSHTVHL
jgi:hypothetical protein